MTTVSAAPTALVADARDLPASTVKAIHRVILSNLGYDDGHIEQINQLQVSSLERLYHEGFRRQNGVSFLSLAESGIFLRDTAAKPMNASIASIAQLIETEKLAWDLDSFTLAVTDDAIRALRKKVWDSADEKGSSRSEGHSSNPLHSHNGSPCLVDVGKLSAQTIKAFCRVGLSDIGYTPEVISGVDSVSDENLQSCFHRRYVKEHGSRDLDLGLSEATLRKSYHRLSCVTDETLGEMVMCNQVNLDQDHFRAGVARRALRIQALGVAQATAERFKAFKDIMRTNGDLQALRTAQKVWEEELTEAMQTSLSSFTERNTHEAAEDS